MLPPPGGRAGAVCEDDNSWLWLQAMKVACRHMRCAERGGWWRHSSSWWCACHPPPHSKRGTTGPTAVFLPRAPPVRPQCPDKKRILLRYVKDVEPALMEAFLEGGPPHVVDAMRATVTNLLGTLPPAFFTVTISTVAENMGQLMLSVLMTGHCLPSAQYRFQWPPRQGRPHLCPGCADHVQWHHTFCCTLSICSRHGPAAEQQPCRAHAGMAHNAAGTESSVLLHAEQTRRRGPRAAAPRAASHAMRPSASTSTNRPARCRASLSLAMGARSVRDRPEATPSQSRELPQGAGGRESVRYWLRKSRLQ